MYIEVLTEIKAIDKPFTYHVPDNITNVVIGCKVLIPYGPKTIKGIVINNVDKPLFDTKDIISVLDEGILNNELLLLGEYMSKTYLCTKMSCYQTMLPSALKFNKNNTKIKYEKYVIKINELSNPSIKEKLILDLFNNNEVLKKDISDKYTLKKLIDKNILKEVLKESYRYNYNSIKTNLKVLNNEQERVYNNIINSKNNVTLLRGVTGSGKTEVYMHLIQNELQNNKTCIVLVPEISLTTQLISRFKSVFDDISVLHSSLSDGEKYDEYRKIYEGKSKIVIGTRSAIFSPIKDLGLIIIDECHDSSYKQENNPRYNTIDIALKRCEINNAKLLLGSATPLVSDYAKAKVGRYNLEILDKRVNDLPLPKVYVIDMKNEIKTGNNIISKKADELIRDRLSKNEQIMILINRRGYSNYLLCNDCGNAIKCPNCDITLTYHKNNNTLRCHYCGYATNMPKMCPLCNSKYITLKGSGTEKIEEYLINKYNAKVIRMDKDTTVKKGSYEKIINDFNSLKYNILIGTQMIAKGFDFPLVTLVIVLNADGSLNIPDYKSGENTFDLLTQTSGRAGRMRNGISVIQTFNKDHYSISLSKEHDYESFYNKEISIRKKLNYPPFCNIVAIRINESNYEKGINEIDKIKKYLINHLDDSYVILGPSISLKINNSYKFQILIKYMKKELLYDILNDIIKLEKINKNNIEIDFNPIRL